MRWKRAPRVPRPVPGPDTRAACPDGCPATTPVLVPVAEGACSPKSVTRCYHCLEVQISRRTHLTDRKEGGSRPLPAPVAHAGRTGAETSSAGPKQSGGSAQLPPPATSFQESHQSTAGTLLSTTLPAAYTGAGAGELLLSDQLSPALASPRQAFLAGRVLVA